MSQWISMQLPEIQALRQEQEAATSHLRKLHALLMSTRRHAYMASAMERCRANGKPPRGLVEFRAQFGEDCLLYELFEGRQDGFFIEAGAFNGVDFSVSFALERLGWNGLLVEAIPQRAEECRLNRPDARVEHAALGAPNGPPTTTFTTVADFYGGMLSRRADTPDALAPRLDAGMQSSSVTVPSRTLDSLLETHTGPIDVVALDLEGGESDALKGFSLSRFRPRVLLIEDISLGRNSPMCEQMKDQPYTLVGWVEMNAIYIRSDDASLLERFGKMALFGW